MMRIEIVINNAFITIVIELSSVSIIDIENQATSSIDCFLCYSNCIYFDCNYIVDHCQDYNDVYLMVMSPDLDTSMVTVFQAIMEFSC